MAEERELESGEEETPSERAAAVHVVPMTPGLGEILSRRPGEMQVAGIPVMPAMVKPGVPRVSARPLGEGVARPEGEERAFEPPEAMKASALKEAAERVGKQTKQLDYRVQDDASSSEKPADLPTTLGQLLSVAAPGALDPGASIGASWPKAPQAPQMQGASTASEAQLGAAADQASQASKAISGDTGFASGPGAGLSAGKGDSGGASEASEASAMFGSGGDFSDSAAGSGAGGEGSRAETNASMGLGKALSGLTDTATQAATLGGQTPF
jgi:hypothetical protein